MYKFKQLKLETEIFAMCSLPENAKDNTKNYELFS